MPLPAGARVGPYETVGALAMSGTGEWYRARESRGARAVALKVCPATRADAEGVRAFLDEARRAGGLGHENLLAVHDAGVGDGTAWIAVEPLEGTTLRDRLAQGPLTPFRA